LICVLCGDLIDLGQVHPSGRRKRADATLCSSHSRPHLGRFIPILIERDGTDCSLCSETVDLDIAFPDPLSPSVDHVIPRSKGGADDVGNYALAHLICNVRKNNRLPGEVMSP